jgi:hypothetical protein
MNNLVIFPSHYVHIHLVTSLVFRPVVFCFVVLPDNHSVPNKIIIIIIIIIITMVKQFLYRPGVAQRAPGS